MGKNKKENIKKKNTVEKEKDIIKDSDYEGSSDNKKIIIVALILALLIGGFAYVRNLDKKVEEPNTEEENNPPVEDEKEPIVDETPEVSTEADNSWQNYYPVTTPSTDTKEEEEEVVVDVWENLNEVPTSLEAGNEFELPSVVVDDEGEELTAVVTYKFKSNEENSEYTTVTEFDQTMIGKYLITYTLNYQGGAVETKDIEIEIVDTTEPLINGITHEGFAKDDVTIEIIEYSPYKVELNGEEYDISLPITEEGEYTLTVTEDTIEGRQSIITFTIDKTFPEITGIEDKKYYNDTEAKVIDVAEVNLDTFVLTKDGVALPFEKAVTEITEEGKYELSATDLAGNNVTYTFVIDRTAPVVDVAYTPDNTELTDSSVTVVITANEEILEVDGWTLSEDKLTLTKEFTENIVESLEVKDLAGNITNVEVIVDYIDYNVEYTPKLTLENLVANKVKATITSLEELTITTEGWTALEVLEDGLYKYEKIYDTNGKEEVNYEDALGNPGVIEVNIEITLTPFVEYVTDEVTGNVTAYVTTEEEVLEENIPEGWTYVTPDDPEAEITEYKYYKEYTETVPYELVEFVTETKHYVATIMIDMDAPVAEEIEVEYQYTDETEEEKESVSITITANEEMQEVENWTLSEDKKSISLTIDKPIEEVPTEEQNEKVIITDIAGNETEVEYTYDWN